MNLVAFSGKKSSGKNTIANWLCGIEMQSYGLIDYSYINEENGRLYVPMVLDDVRGDGAIDLNRSTPWLEEMVYPYVRQFSYGDYLKNSCMKLFGLTYEQCFGTNEDKNSASKVKSSSLTKTELKKLDGEIGEYLTSRQVLQHFGNYCRGLNTDCWVDAIKNILESDPTKFALITDCRFPNEAEMVHELGGKVVRLTRNIYDDKHESETALDDYQDFDLVIDNAEMTIGQQNQAIYEYLRSINYITYEIKEGN